MGGAALVGFGYGFLLGLNAGPLQSAFDAAVPPAAVAVESLRAGANQGVRVTSELSGLKLRNELARPAPTSSVSATAKSSSPKREHELGKPAPAAKEGAAVGVSPISPSELSKMADSWARVGRLSKWNPVVAYSGKTYERIVKRMERFRKRKAIYIHIFKTGGTTVEKVVLDGAYTIHTSAWEFKVAMPDFFDECFKFATVRHPGERLLSAYWFRRRGGIQVEFDIQEARAMGIYEFPRSKNFTGFTWLQMIGKFLAKDGPRGSLRLPFDGGDELSYVEDPRDPRRETLLVDKIIKLENLVEEMGAIAPQLGFDREALMKRLRAKRNANTHDAYKSATPPHYRFLIERAYFMDFKVLGYELEFQHPEWDDPPELPPAVALKNVAFANLRVQHTPVPPTVF